MSYEVSVFIATLFVLEIGASLSLLYLLPALWRAGRSQSRLKLTALAVLVFPVLVLIIVVAIEWWIAWPHLGDARFILGVFLSSIVFALALRAISGASIFLVAVCAATAVAMVPFPIVEHLSNETVFARVDFAFMIGFVIWNVVLGVWVTIWSADDRNKWIRSDRVSCRCGYDLVGLPGPRCPECGDLIPQLATPQD